MPVSYTHLLQEIELATLLQLVLDEALRHLAIAGFRQGIPEQEALGHLVASDLGAEEIGDLGFRRVLARPVDADRDADLAPDRIGHAEHGDLGDRRMGQDLLLSLIHI